MRNVCEDKETERRRKELSRRSEPTQRAALKTALEDTIKAMGGYSSAEHSTRVTDTQLQRCADPLKDDFITLDVALDLILGCPYPYLAEALLRPKGYSIVRNEDMPTARPQIEDIGPLAEAIGPAVVKWLEIWADGRMDEHERREFRPFLEKIKANVRDFDSKFHAACPHAVAAE